jgi:hypothetical protein
VLKIAVCHIDTDDTHCASRDQENAEKTHRQRKAGTDRNFFEHIARQSR